jgi:hypothetical protein
LRTLLAVPDQWNLRRPINWPLVPSQKQKEKIMMLAQAVVDIGKGETLSTLWGLIGIMVLAITVLTFIILIQKVFGRKPPIDKALAALRQEIYHANGSIKKELSKRIDGVEVDVEEIKLDRERKWTQLQTEMKSLELKFATMTGRIETVLSKLENR